MTPANTVYLNHPAIDFHIPRYPVPVRAILAALLVLDLILIFWMFDPLSKRSASLSQVAYTADYSAKQAPLEGMQAPVVEKRSPLGPVVKAVKRPRHR